MNNKKKRIKFVKDANKHLLSLGATIKSQDERSTVYSLGTCTLKIYDESDHKEVFSIFGRFEGCNELTGKYNAKYNYHGIDGQFGLCGWEEYLNEIAEHENN